jgi:hypothetical protein
MADSKLPGKKSFRKLIQSLSKNKNEKLRIGRDKANIPTRAKSK